VVKLSANFSRDEFACRDGTRVPELYEENLQRLVKNLQVLRYRAKRRVIIASGYRTVLHNQGIGGHPNSYHLEAMAADLIIADPAGGAIYTFQNNVRLKCWHGPRVYGFVEALIAEGLIEDGGLGMYANRIHYDTGPTGRRWRKGI